MLKLSCSGIFGTLRACRVRLAPGGRKSTHGALIGPLRASTGLLTTLSEGRRRHHLPRDMGLNREGQRGRRSRCPTILNKDAAWAALALYFRHMPAIIGH